AAAGAEEQHRRPGLPPEPVRLRLATDRLEELVDRPVLLRLLEGDEEQRRVLALDVCAALPDELGVVALEGTVPDLHAGDALNLRLLPHLHRALVVRDALRVRRAVLLDRL